MEKCMSNTIAFGTSKQLLKVIYNDARRSRTIFVNVERDVRTFDLKLACAEIFAFKFLFH